MFKERVKKKFTTYLGQPEGLRHMLVPSAAVAKQFVQTSLHKLLARVGAALNGYYLTVTNSKFIYFSPI